MPLKGNVTINGAEKETEKRNKKIIFKNWAPFTGSISEINNTPWCCDADVWLSLI